MATPCTQVKQHPILPACLVRADGSLGLDLRVYCDTRGCSVSVDVCRQCPSCIEIERGEGDARACVRCSPPEGAVPVAVPSTGATLSRGVVTVEESVLVRDIVALFVERKLRMIVVTDVNGRACGAVHDSQLLREIQDVAHGGLRLGWASPAAQPASFIMRSVTTISETAPLREAVTSMATAHQRQLLVVDEHGFPIGLLVDVDALHGLHARD